MSFFKLLCFFFIQIIIFAFKINFKFLLRNLSLINELIVKDNKRKIRKKIFFNKTFHFIPN